MTGERRREEWVHRALCAERLYERDRHYVVRDGKIETIDLPTGRRAPDRSFEGGIQSLIEIREGLTLTPQRETLARINYQRFFRRYLRLAGMTGTAREVSRELWNVYGLRTVIVPTRLPSQRVALGQKLLPTAEAKWEAVVMRIDEIHREGRPVLVGTSTVATSEHLSALLDRAGLRHEVLSARQDQEEAAIVARAGEPGCITVATRMAGVWLDEFGLTSLVLLTAEPLVKSRVRGQANTVGRRAAQLQRELAARKLQTVEQVHHQLSARTAAGTRRRPSWLGAAREKIQLSDAALAAGDYATGYREAQRGMRPLRLLQRTHWESAARLLPSPVTSPASGLVCHTPMALEPDGADRLGPARSECGCKAVISRNWARCSGPDGSTFQHPSPGVYAEADLTSEAAHSGRFGLRLAAQPIEPDQPEILVESPPSWITGPAVPVQAGELVSIHGWVQVPEPIRGSVDGLLIIDSLSGEALAERIVETAGWQEFTLYRVATEPGNIALTFALSGVGEAWVDDVTVQTVPLGASRPTRMDVGRLPGPSHP